MIYPASSLASEARDLEPSTSTSKTTELKTYNLKISREGRVLIPAHLRRKLGMETDSELVARVEDGTLVLEAKDNILRRLHARFAHVAESVSLADELIADRRRDAALEP